MFLRDERHPANGGVAASATSADLTASHDGHAGRVRPAAQEFPGEPRRAPPRTSGAPAYYLGRPARRWIAAMRPRRRRAPERSRRPRPRYGVAGPAHPTGFGGPVRRVGAEQTHVVPEQADHVDAGVGAEHLDVEPETVGVSATQFLYGKAAEVVPLQDHPVATDDGSRTAPVLRAAGALARGGGDHDVGSVGPDAGVADARVEAGAAGGQHVLVCAQQPAIWYVVRDVVDLPLAGQAGELGQEHEPCRHAIPDISGDFKRLPCQFLAVQHRAEVGGRYAQHRPAAAGILPDKARAVPERVVPGHVRRALLGQRGLYQVVRALPVTAQHPGQPPQRRQPGRDVLGVFGVPPAAHRRPPPVITCSTLARGARRIVRLSRAARFIHPGPMPGPAFPHQLRRAAQ
jgi:hypothetical protein